MKSRKAQYIGLGCLLIGMLLIFCLPFLLRNHKHSAIETWQSDETKHWHSCASEDCEKRLELGRHAWDKGVVKAEATCTHQGEIMYTCKDCQATKFEKIACKKHQADDTWEYDNQDHWKICKNCDEVFSVAAHKWRSNPVGSAKSSKFIYTCTICGKQTDKKPVGVDVKRGFAVYKSTEIATMATIGDGEYLFVPLLDGGNFNMESGGNQKISVKWGLTDFGYSILLGVPVNAETVVLKPTEIMSKENLQKLRDAGYTEVTSQLTFRITGGKWWGSEVTVKAPWTNSSYSISKFDNNVAGPLKVKFSLEDAIQNYDMICEKGLFEVHYANQAYDSYEINFTPFEITNDHEWGAEWQKDDKHHYHACIVCGASKDIQEHTLTGKTCSVCGPLDKKIYIPAGNGSNLTIENEGNKTIDIRKAEANSGNMVTLSVPENAGKIRLMPTDILSQAKLKALLEDGYTEVRLFLTTEIIGGKWWPGTVNISAPWSAMTYSSNAFKNNVLGPMELKFPLKDLIANYDKMLADGLLHILFDNQAHDIYEISISAVEASVRHEWIDEWTKTDDTHYHLCSICGEKKDEAGHQWQDEKTCSICGIVNRYLFNPELDGSNFTIKNTGNKDIVIGSANTNLGATIILQVPEGAGSIILLPDAIKDKAALETLVEKGLTEVTSQLVLEITGGKWWGGKVTVSTPWSSKTYSANTVKNTTGIMNLKFALSDVIANYEKVCEEGLFKVYFNNEAYDTYSINFAGFGIVEAHEWDTEWSKDASKHYHACTICGSKQDVTPHDWNDEWKTDETGHWHECKACDIESEKEAHTPNGNVWHSDNSQHWRVCIMCSRRVDAEPHDWVFVGEEANCNDCGATATSVVTSYTVKHLLENANGDYVEVTADTKKYDALAGSNAVVLTNQYVGYEVSSKPEDVVVQMDGSTVVEIKYDYVTPVFTDTIISNTDKKVEVGKAYSIGVENLAGRTVQWSADGVIWTSTQPHFTNPGTYVVYYKCAAIDDHPAVEGSNTVTIRYYMNDLMDIDGVKVAYTDYWNASKVSEGAKQFGSDATTGDRYFKAWIAPWTKSKSLKFYAPLNIAKEDVKELLDAGVTTLSVTIKQSFMNESPWWGITNKVGADWMSTIQTVNNKEDYKELTFSLSDFYSHYDDIAAGTIPLLKFDLSHTFTENEGGIIGYSSWTSSSYDITIKNIEVKTSDTSYTVKHMLQKADGTYLEQTEDTQRISAQAGATVNTLANKYVGYQVSSMPENTTVSADGSTVLEVKYDYAAPVFEDAVICNTDSGVNVGNAYSIQTKNLEGRQVQWSTDGSNWSDEQPHFVIPGTYVVYYKCAAIDAHPAVEGSNTVTIRYYMNDLMDIDGVKVSYIDNWNASKVSEGAARFSGDVATDNRYFRAWIAPWTKSKSLKFYAPLNISKEDVKELLDAGAMTLSVTIKQPFMNESPWWGITNKVGADWTSIIQTVNNTEDYKELTFSLSDFYSRYDDIAAGTIPLLKFDLSHTFTENEGGIIGYSSWTSSSYDIFIKNIEVK